MNSLCIKLIHNTHIFTARLRRRDGLDRQAPRRGSHNLQQPLQGRQEPLPYRPREGLELQLHRDDRVQGPHVHGAHEALPYHPHVSITFNGICFPSK